MMQRLLRSHTGGAHVKSRPSRRRVRDRLAVLTTTERVTAVVVSVLTIVVIIGLIPPERPISGVLARPTKLAALERQLPPSRRQTVPKTPLLPAATMRPLPASSSVASAPPLLPHEVFGFVPYWSLGQSDGFAVAGLTTLDYFSVGINPNGTLDQSGSGWNGYESQALSTLITRAHGAGARVVLTVNDFDQHSLDELTSSPTAATTLSKALIGAIQAKNLDGVNLDLEGSGSTDQAGLTGLVTTVSEELHQVNSHWQVTMDTYASSAGDPGGFYDISALANAVDAFFVMEYSPNVAASAQASSPLTSSLFSDLTTVQQYATTAPGEKVILGTPLYGEDWPTTGSTLSATATGPATTPTDSEIENAGNPIFWDSVTDSAWTAYQIGNQWHETFFDDPTTLYQIAELAKQYGLGGVGVWALGTEGTNPAMIDALDGSPPAIQYATPSVPTTTVTATTTPTSAVGEGVPASSPGGESGNRGTAPGSLVPSITGTFEAESLAAIQNFGTSSPPSVSHNVTLCLVTKLASPSAACRASPPPSVGATTSTGDATAPMPPFPGATVAGLLSGIAVENDATLSCLENDNQLEELAPVPTTMTMPELVVWQWPGDQQYYYVVTATMSASSSGAESADCVTAVLAFLIPSQTPVAVQTQASASPST